MSDTTKQVIQIFGAGRSSYFLFKYLHDRIDQNNYEVSVYSNEISNPEWKTEFLKFNWEIIDIQNINKVETIVKASSLVVSMLPASLHLEIAKICIKEGKSLFTASYVSDEMKAMEDKVKSKNLLFLNECGLDPGLDHMSAKATIDDIEAKGGKIKGFESFTGGLIAPECMDNPWGYKITWNPKNVALAGQGGAAKFYQKGSLKYIPYHKLFRRTEIIDVPNFGKYEGYANRDSTKYKEIYELNDAETVFRGTLRIPGFCRAWHALIELGITDNQYRIPHAENMTYRDFTNLFLAYNPHDSVEIKVQRYLRIAQDDFDLWDRLVYLGLFEKEKIGLKNPTPAEVLEKLLIEKLKLGTYDRDRIVMHHIFEYELNGLKKTRTSSMVLDGESPTKTAMAKTVGTPLAIAIELYLKGEINISGVQIPVIPEIYSPILKKLQAEFDISFVEIDH
jgi:saccharopine dehydrogenase-like NADP-dependent oxidoreductase